MKIHKSYMLKMPSECGLELCNVVLQDETWFNGMLFTTVHGSDVYFHQ